MIGVKYVGIFHYLDLSATMYMTAYDSSAVNRSLDKSDKW